MKFVHVKCLVQWLKPQLAEGNVDNLNCELCKGRFNARLKLEPLRKIIFKLLKQMRTNKVETAKTVIQVIYIYLFMKKAVQAVKYLLQVLKRRAKSRTLNATIGSLYVVVTILQILYLM